MLVGLAAGMLIFGAVLSRVHAFTELFYRLMERVPVEVEYLEQILKMLGITYVADFSANICRDAGYQAVAGQIELFAKISILVLSIPGIIYILEIVERFV